MHSGYHYLPVKGLPNPIVRGHDLERATRIEQVGSTASWRFKETVPKDGTMDARLWFSAEDFAHLMIASEDDVRAMAREERWRSRQHNTSKLRQYYLYDVLATVWRYMCSWEGNKIDLALLEEAINRVE